MSLQILTRSSDRSPERERGVRVSIDPTLLYLFVPISLLVAVAGSGPSFERMTMLWSE
jgi:hypothetical protein